MAGHSKWANIKHRKAATDAKRGAIFSRLIRQITVASRLGGADASANPRLRHAIDKATDQNMPKDTIERAIKRGSGGLEDAHYEEIRYEGYGINGAAVIVDCMTDNRTRTVADVRHAFSKYGGNLGTDGSVAYLFKHCGQIVFAPGTNEDKVIEAALDAGADDVITNDDGIAEVGPVEVAVEKVFVNINPNSTLLLGQARGAAIAAAVLAGLSVTEYTAGQVKQSVVGGGRAQKSQVQEMVRRLLHLPGMPQADAADALATAICQAHASTGMGGF